MYGILPKDARQNIELGKLPTERMSQRKFLPQKKSTALRISVRVLHVAGRGSERWAWHGGKND